jgi:hypothetical protein
MSLEGREIQLKIWIGSAVNSESSPSGLKAMIATAPARIRGAVSPIARDRARITPVAIPGIAAGRTCFQIVCHWVAPRASEPSRIEGGTARIASRPAMITTGSTSRPRVSPPAKTTAPKSKNPRTRKASPRMP